MTKQTDEKRRRDRFYQQKHRGSKQSYVTEVENLRILLAWEAGELSEGQVARYLNIDRVDLRDMKIGAIARGLELVNIRRINAVTKTQATASASALSRTIE
jgi:hypothetical protein